MIDQLKAFRQAHPWKARLSLTLTIIFLLLILLRIVLSPSIIYGATSWLKSQGINASIETIDIDILDGTVSLLNAEGIQDNKSLFHIGRVDIHWQWSPLSDKTITVSKINLNELSVNIKHYSDSIIIGGVNIPLGETAKEADTDIVDNSSEQLQKPWAANLGEVTFTDLNVCYLQHKLTKQQSTANSPYVDYCVTLAELSWAGSVGYAPDVIAANKENKDNDIPLSSSGDFTLNGLSITDNRLARNLLVSGSNKLKNVSISGLNNIHIQELQMNKLSLLQRDDKQHIDAIRFEQFLISDISLSDFNSLSINSIAIANPGFYMVKIDEKNWEYQQWIPKDNATIKDDSASTETTTKQDASSFSVKVNSFKITASDMCYLQKDISLYYCMTFDELNWIGATNFDSNPTKDGDLNLRLDGELTLTAFNVNNKTIDRTLAEFNSLDLTKLRVKGLNDISLAKFDLQSLNAMQRSKDAKDNTASFDHLSINDIKYSKNNVAVDTIKLSGLANSVSKNKDGTWEHAKWSSNKPEAINKKSGDRKKKAAKQEPLVLSLNKFEVESKHNIDFTDNSTQPAMNIGLRELKFHIDNLHSTSPETDSPFKLYAKTKLHSTIDIAGTIKPLAEKISMDATGKLKGFDLRAATPATKKAIGHVIKSGQLDADLTLKATDGELDSNVALSLYHLRIKSESKKDSEELDKKFGMPLNQTLVLLRDKDDSIHLDIPITGDINNPNFNPMDAIITATSKAATVTLITFYTPYGLIYAGGNLALNLATALNFDPITFTPGSSELQGENQEQLESLSKLMTEKPSVHLTLCGKTNHQDVYKLFPELQKQKVEHDKKNTEDEKQDFVYKLNKEQENALEELASQRQINSKNFLIEKYKLEHDRLILCAPEHSIDDEAIAGVEITI